MDPLVDGLGPDLARRIVERAMDRLGHNVNVMDADGVIVGSGDLARLGEVHEGALLAIRGGRTVTVDQALADRMSGVRPGVNAPIVVDGRTVGAIGLTGDPETLGEVGHLLQMAAELMVQQAADLDDEQWRSTRLDTVVRALVRPDQDSAERATVRRRAEGLGIDLDVPRHAVLVLPRRGPVDGRVHAARRALHRSGLHLLTALLEPEQLLVLVPDDVATEALLSALGPVRRGVVLVVGPSLGPGVDALPISCAAALDVVAVRPPGRPADDADVVLRWTDDPLPALVAGLDDDWRTAALADPWNRLATADAVLATTVVAYLESGGDLAATAAHLHVHRNTLRHRLDRAATLSGVDVRDVRGAAHLLVGAVRAGRLCMRTVDDG